MVTEYNLGKTNSGKPSITCNDNTDSIIKDLSMYGFGDCISFYVNGPGSIYGSDWGLNNLGCFKELRNYERLSDMPHQSVEYLAKRIYELLFMKNPSDERYQVKPIVDTKDVRYIQILEELKTLQKMQKEMVSSGKVVFPEISSEELAWADLW
jgi:hypothetical protein